MKTADVEATVRTCDDVVGARRHLRRVAPNKPGLMGFARRL
ncbi:hypothetical protein [Bradyrhizobium iriomotense]|nr:hypothetical protein [Bradyrhizobium iriomotense]